MQLVTPTSVNVAANPRVPNPFYKIKGLNFPTTREIQQSFFEIQNMQMPFPLLDRFFPEKNTTATEIEMYIMRSDSNDGYLGMTFPHQTESGVRTFDLNSKVDLAKASWSPLSFKESKVWGEKNILELGRLVEDVSSSTILEQIAEFMVVMRRRMRTRKQWMAAQILNTGKITINKTDADNPNRLGYVIDYGVTDFELDMPVKFDDKSNGVSGLDPIEWAQAINRAGKYTGRKLVEMIVNSNFVEYLTDNTYMQNYIDWERGQLTTMAQTAPRAMYRQMVLELFTRLTGVIVTMEDSTYEDDSHQAHYWVPDGSAILLYGNTGPLGNFVNTAHIQGGNSTDGGITISTGEYMFTSDNTKSVNPRYEIVGGFNGLPQLTGYDMRDFGFHRLKHVTFGRNASNFNAPLPKRTDIGAALPA